MHNFRELKIWQRSIELAEVVYKTTVNFPLEEKYGLVSQLRRSAVSVASNIAEGAGRATNKQFKYFLGVAMGSCNELQTQLELSFRFGFLTKEEVDRLNDEIIQIYKMILVLYNSLKDE